MKRIIVRDIKGEKSEIEAHELSFRPSVYGVIIENGSVLLVPQWDGYDFPGGGVDLGETLDEAFRREVKEETGLDVGMGELALLAEDFFTHPSSGRHFQSILFYYTHTDVSGVISDEGFTGFEKEIAKKAEWVPIEKALEQKFYNPIDSPSLIQKVAGMKK